MLAMYQDDHGEARQRLGESLSLREDLGDRLAPADLAKFQGDLARDAGDLATAQAFFERSLALNRALGNEQGVAEALHDLSRIVSEQNEYGRARALCAESLLVHRKLDDQQGIAWMLLELGWIDLRLANLESAAMCFRESLLVSRAFKFNWGILHTVDGFADIAAQRGQLDRALLLGGAAEAIRDHMQAWSIETSRPRCLQLPEFGWRRSWSDSAPSAWLEGQVLTLEQAIAVALDQS
jgi:tetratricopeptide (TPR) repeat protein